ncbi:MAG: hypothetical protein SynsKO_39340 [Synoicihabitans sp.]
MTSSFPLATVLMPTYNSAKFVGAAVESILNQTVDNFELLIVDDGSSDDTVSVVQSYRDPRIRLVQRSTNGGIVAALNDGLAQIQSPFVMRMDADDVSLPERLKIQIKYLEQNQNLALCGSDFFPLIEGATELSSWVKFFEPEQVSVACLFTNPICHPTVTFRRSLLPTEGYTAAYPHAEDFAMWITLSEHSRITNLPDKLLKYRVHPEQVSKTDNPAQSRSTESLLRQQLKRLALEPTEPEMIAHRALGGAFVPHPRLEMFLERWTQRILKANEEFRIWNAVALQMQINRRREDAMQFHNARLKEMPFWRRWRWRAYYRQLDRSGAS